VERGGEQEAGKDGEKFHRGNDLWNEAGRQEWKESLQFSVLAKACLEDSAQFSAGRKILWRRMGL
jgi:hypothetical protein